MRSLSVINNKSVSISNRSKRTFNIFNECIDSTTHVQSSFIYYIFSTTHKRSLYNFRKPYTIEEVVALDTTRRSSIYQRACITNHMISLANDFKNYKF